MQYALDNLLTTEAGMRDDRVIKALEISTNVQPDDEAIHVAAKARELGYLVCSQHMLFVQSYIRDKHALSVDDNF